MNQYQWQHRQRGTAVLTDAEKHRRSEAAREALEEAQARAWMETICMAVQVGPSKEEGKVRVKFLGLPGCCGPELNIAQGTALQLHRALTSYIQTGIEQTDEA